MDLIIAALVMAGALLISFAIPPHHLFSRQRAEPQPSDPAIHEGDAKTR